MPSSGEPSDDLSGRLIAAFEQQERALERLALIFERHDRAFERMEARWERVDAGVNRMEAGLERNDRAWVNNIAALESIRTALEDLSDQIRANTRAAWHMLDRFGEGGEPA